MAKKNKDTEAVSEKKAKKAKKDKQKVAARVRNVFGHPVRNLIVAAVACILLGVAFILKPYEVSLYCGYGVGGLIGLFGIVYIILYLCAKPVSGEYRSEFAIGLLALFAGAYVALSGFITGGTGVGYVLVIRILGILLLADALLKIQYSMDIARMKFPRWWLVLLFGLMGAGIGVVTATDFDLTAAPSTTPASFLYGLGGSIGLVTDKGQYNAFFSGMMLLGIGFCVNGVLDLASMAVIAVRNHKARRAEAIAEGAAMVAAAKQEELNEILPPEAAAPAPENVVYVPAPTPAPAPAAEPVIPASAPAPVIKEPVQATPVAPAE